MPDFDLPTRNDVLAPWFNENNPHELAGYFKELEYLFERHRVSDATQRKQSAVRYVSADVRELWQCAATWDDPTRSYEAFKAEVHAFYPEATDTLRYTTWDLSALVNERARCEMKSVEDLGAFYRKFIVISTFLIKRDRLSTLEQARWFLGAFSGNQAARLQEFLESKHPDVQMDKIPDIGNYFQAAQSVLRQQRDLTLMTMKTVSQAPLHPGERLGNGAMTAHVATAAALEIAPKKAPACPSVLATARYIEDINCITYPEGVEYPNAELNINTQKGKFRYDRDFLLQFMNICKEKPDKLPPLESIGLVRRDASHLMSQGGSGRNRAPKSTTAPAQAASIGLGFSPGSMGKNAGAGFQMGQFSTSSNKMSSEVGSCRSPSASVSSNPLSGCPPVVVRRDRTRQKRGGGGNDAGTGRDRTPPDEHTRDHDEGRN